jgi:VWFA-related protein
MIKAELPELRAAGKTALYDGLATAVSLLREGRGQRAIVLLSDGRDTTSQTFFQQVLDFARQGGVTVYAIGLGLSQIDRMIAQARGEEDPIERIQKEAAREMLTQLAAASGGRAYYVSRAEQLEEVYDRIGEDLRSRYLLTYQTESGDEERSRRAEVRVKKRGLKARTAWRGYSP